MAPSTPILVKGLCFGLTPGTVSYHYWALWGLAAANRLKQVVATLCLYDFGPWVFTSCLSDVLPSSSVLSVSMEGAFKSRFWGIILFDMMQNLHSSPVTHSLCNISEQILEASWALLLNHHRPTSSRCHRGPWEEVKRRLSSPKWNDHLSLGFFVFCCVCTLSS